MFKTLMFLLLATSGFAAFGFGGRPNHLGPGIGGSQTLHLEKPTYKERDTIAFYAAMQKTKAPIYNESETNELLSAQIYKSYSKRNFNFVGGLRGYHGAYGYPHSSDYASITYSGAGLVAEAEYVARGRFVDFVLSSQLSCVYEFGDFQRMQQEVLKYYDEMDYGGGIYFIWKSPIVPSHSLGIGLNFRPIPDFQFGIAAGLNLPAVPIGTYSKVHTSYRSVGAYYLVSQPETFFGYPPMYGPGHRLGLSYVLPFGRGRKQSKDNQPQIPDDQ